MINHNIVRYFHNLQVADVLGCIDAKVYEKMLMFHVLLLFEIYKMIYLSFQKFAYIYIIFEDVGDKSGF